MHIGRRNNTSSLSTFRYLFPVQVFQTFGWYIFSAWWFTEVYLWSCAAEAHLEMVKRARSHERAALNERPIYIHTFHLVLACVQAASHLYWDYDSIPIPVTKPRSNAEDQRTHPVPPTLKHIQSALPERIYQSLVTSGTVAVVGPIVYRLFLRQTAWSVSLYFAKLFWNFPRSASQPDTFLPPGIFFLIFRSFFSGSCLILCWQLTNLFFTIFIGKEPLRREQPLTADAKDPNGSLLTGLKAKKPLVKTYALWELSLISQRLPERRKTIFNEIDRDTGKTWSQVSESLIGVIKDITVRIEASKAPAAAAPQAKTAEPVLHKLPRLTDAPKEENVFAASPRPVTRKERIGDAFTSTAKYFGQAEDWTPKARARTREILDHASSAMLSPEHKKKLISSSNDLKLIAGGSWSTYKPENIHPVLFRALRSPVGQLVQQTYAQRASSIVLGSPDTCLSQIIDAIDSLTRLLIASLAEDTYGNVQSDVLPVVRLFTETITVVDAFVHKGGLDAHWTDVNFPPASKPEEQAKARHVPDVDLVLESLRGGLSSLLEAFQPYLRDIKLEGKDLRLANEAANPEVEDDSP
ncbi:nucleoporin NDC1 [Penicillium chermesinum]|nr:nucleoporin NDC1 [Penicillium chermesinum]